MWMRWVGVISGKRAWWGSLESGDNGMRCVDVGADNEHDGAWGLEWDYALPCKGSAGVKQWP